MIRVSGFLLLVCWGGLGGEYLLSRQRRALGDMETGIRLLELLIWEFGHHPDEIGHLPGQLAQETCWNRYLPREFRFLDQLLAPDTLPPGARVRLSQCFASLGHQEAAASVRAMEQTLHWMEVLRQNRQQRLVRDSRLYRPMGFCCGLALAILLL